MNWEEKYRPRKVSKLFVTKDQIKKVKQYIHETKPVIITGNCGVGKNTFINLILDKLNYRKVEIDDLKNNEMIDNLVNNKKIKSITKIDSRKICFVIKNIDWITSTKEKNNINQLINSNYAIILVASLQHSKYISTLKKNCEEIKISNPGTNLIKLITKIISKEKMILDEKSLKLLLIFCQEDIRKTINVLQDIYNTFGTEITFDKVKKFISNSQQKNLDTNLFKSCRQIMDNYKSIENCLNYYREEKVLLPITIYENYTKAVCASNYNEKEKLETLKYISETLSYGDVIETNIYTDQNWHLQDIHGFMTCIKPSYKLSKKEHKYYDIIFNDDFNKTSQAKTMKKKIDQLRNIYNGKSLYDFMFMTEIIIKFLKDKEYSKLSKFMLENNMKLNDVEELIKINKNYGKICLKVSERKKIQELLSFYSQITTMLLNNKIIEIAINSIKFDIKMDLISPEIIRDIKNIIEILNSKEVDYKEIIILMRNHNLELEDLKPLLTKSVITKHKKKLDLLYKNE